MDVIAMARELGAALQQSDEYTAYNVAKNAADGDEVLQEMIGEFNLKKLSLSTEVQKEEKDQKKLAALNARLELVEKLLDEKYLEQKEGRKPKRAPQL